MVLIQVEYRVKRELLLGMPNQYIQNHFSETTSGQEKVVTTIALRRGLAVTTPLGVSMVSRRCTETGENEEKTPSLPPSLTSQVRPDDWHCLVTRRSCSGCLTPDVFPGCALGTTPDFVSLVFYEGVYKGSVVLWFSSGSKCSNPQLFWPLCLSSRRSSTPPSPSMLSAEESPGVSCTRLLSSIPKSNSSLAGDKTCVAGATCQAINDYYYQCL